MQQVRGCGGGAACGGAGRALFASVPSGRALGLRAPRAGALGVCLHLLPQGGSVPHDWAGLRGAVHGSCSALRGPADASVVSSVFVDSLLEAPVEWGSPSLRAVKALALSAASHPGFRVVTAGNIQC